MFAITSRYQGIPTAVLTLPDGRQIVYVRRRFVPHPEDLTQIGEHVVLPGERPDQIAAQEFGDPEQSWRLADANRALEPDELTTPGRHLRITLPAAATQIGGVLSLSGSAGNG